MRNNLYNPTIPQAFKAGMVFKGGGGGGGDPGGVEVAAPAQPSASPGYAPGQVISPGLPQGYQMPSVQAPPPLNPGQALTQNTGLASYTDMPPSMSRIPQRMPQGVFAPYLRGGPGSTPGTRVGANSGGGK